MRSRLAGLLAAVFAAAVIAPPDGVVVHRHAGGDHLHVHADLAPGSHREPRNAARHDGHDHEHAGDHHHGHHHDHDDHGHHPAAPHHHDDDHTVTLTAASGGGIDHLHTLPLFDQAVAPAPLALAPPRPLARLAQASPPVRVSLARPTTRSRAPPARST